MAKTSEKIVAEIAAAEEETTILRNKKRDLVLALANAKDEEDRKMVKTYWDKRIKDDPDSAEVLRARAALLDAASAESSVVIAASAIIEAEGNL